MAISKAEFLESNTDYTNCPKPDKPEYAFIGRSNVGKSSLINMLTGFSKLAKVSSKPGKTRLINHFLINEKWFLVDLPGYGWAKIAKSERENWDVMIKNYLKYRPNLMCVFVLIDSRLEAQKNDLEFLDWLGNNEVPFVIIFTKIDKQTFSKVLNSINIYKQKLLETWDDLPNVFTSSSVSLEGKNEIISFIVENNLNFTYDK